MSTTTTHDDWPDEPPTTARLYLLADEQPEALAVLRLVHTDVEEQLTTPQLRVEIACRKLGLLVNPDATPDLYTPLRDVVEMWVEADADLRDDLTSDEADGEVLHALWVLLHRAYPCRQSFATARHLGMLHDAGSCEHGQRAA